MDPKLRVVTSTPLDELWDETGPIDASRVKELKAEDVRGLLKLGPVNFVIAEIGAPLRWIAPRDCFHFWKDEVHSHLASESPVELNNYPGNYCYFASEWSCVAHSGAIILLQMSH